jgi:hypothetical protein
VKKKKLTSSEEYETLLRQKDKQIMELKFLCAAAVYHFLYPKEVTAESIKRLVHEIIRAVQE